MANPHRYEPDQWAFMNRPETQAKIRHELDSYIRRFIDTAPDGKTLERSKELVAIIKRCFEKELRDAEASPPGVERVERCSAAELVLSALSAAMRMIPTDERLRQGTDEILASPPLTDEEFKAREKELEAFDTRLAKEGLKGWWD